MKKLVMFLLFTSSVFSSSFVLADAISDAVANESRPIAQRMRDEYRHPQQTLRFFDVQPNMAVAEISPGGGWYSNILAPLLKEQGTYYAAHFYVDEFSHPYYQKGLARFKKMLGENPLYSAIKLSAFHPIKAPAFAPAGSLDRVLTFRNIHNWYMDDGDEGVDKAFASFFTALTSGGVLGVVEHRLPEIMSDKLQLKSGYMKQSYVIGAAEKAGFKLLAKSDINQNSLDGAEHENGVWSLPPSLSLGDKDKAKYLNIGESNRMTLKFVKPAAM